MASPNASVKLRTGSEVPAVGLGVFLVRPGQEAYNAVTSALKIGYRHVDTARMYRNEADVGKAIKHSGLPRDSIFITSKLYRVDWGYNAATKAVNSSLASFGLSYLDLMLMHHPADREGRHETWQALEDAQAQVYKSTTASANICIIMQPALAWLGHLSNLQLQHAMLYQQAHGVCTRQRLSAVPWHPLRPASTAFC